MRALDGAWDRRVARLPERGVLLACTDLQGNLGDYEAALALYRSEQDAGNDPILVFCGDLVHGPSPDLHEPGAWPDYLGTEYRDRSVEVLQRLEVESRSERLLALLGNHEHAHIGGPVVPKFWPDEAAVLDEALGDDRDRMHAFLRTFPLIATSACGVVLCHAAPRATAPSLQAFEDISYGGYRHRPIWSMQDVDPLGALLWARHASDAQALDLLEVVTGRRAGVVVWGHDVVRSGYVKHGEHHVCVSSSFGLDDARKVVLRVDLSGDYASTGALREGTELIPLHPS